MWIGILCGLSAGALWGLSFAVPKVLPDLSSTQVAFGRFLFYGVLSSALLCLDRQGMRVLLRRDIWKSALLLSLAGNALYYALLVYAVRLVGVSLTSLIIGLLPLTIAFASAGGKMPKAVLPSLGLIGLGVLLINVDVFQRSVGQGETSLSETVLGLILVSASLVMWTWYAVANARFLQKHPEISSRLWTNIIGVFSLMAMAVVLLTEVRVGHVSLPKWDALSPAVQLKIVAGSAILGIGSSWLATLLWNIASQRLATGLVGQLIVSETLFALLYGFCLEGRLPRFVECLASLFLIAGVVLAIRAYPKGH